MPKRKPTSKKLRFEIFKRDSFTCQYCGKTPPSVVLEVDHVIPVCNGGKTEAINLITACFDCNRGKGGNDLCHVMPAVNEQLEAAIEQEEQLKAYNRLLKSKRLRENKQIKEIETALFGGAGSMTDSFKHSIRTQFIAQLTHDEIMGAAYKAGDKCNSPYNASKYFCGICWNMIKGR